MMTNVLCGAIVVWICGLYFLASLNARDAEAVFENIAPGERHEAVQPSPSRVVREGSFWLIDALFIGPGLAVAVRLLGRIFNLDGYDAGCATKIDAARLTDAGRAHLKRAIRNERIMYAWMAAGSVLLVYAVYYFKNQ
ncbi:hypothetical protein JQ604_30780 [Bradyrhizobium jicamae]|uniref:hypothetical protein n=1 Tax=Bradyrhizobium jicamae TaxID=280332 RepID=UPI001BA5D107|nr:hypothetical protein [Bradyrhizobium jicamae]MBR0756586.1 hypothetical protein [Bradyrhizobium jicamae]